MTLGRRVALVTMLVLVSVPAAPTAAQAQTGVAPVGRAELIAAAGAAAVGGGAQERADRAAVAQWMAGVARAAGLPGELPVMAALAASGLRNLPAGRRAGYFRMRTSVWNGGRYAGFPARPELQMRWFIDIATLVRQARRDAGARAFGRSPSTWGRWIAVIQRPRSRSRSGARTYQSRLAEARALLGTPVGAIALLDLAGPPPPAPLRPAPRRRSGVAVNLARRVVADRRIELSPQARGDLLAGRIDPRVAAMLLAAAARERISVTVLLTGHSVFTAGGSVSNHYFGQAVDIGTVAGRPVNAGNQAALDLAVEVGRLRPVLRPTEIGSPWVIGGPAHFTDGDHQDHLHLGFDTPFPATG